MKSYCIPQLASGYIEYDMIEQYTELPVFPDARVHLLYIFLNSASRITLDQAELYALVTSLVQIGIDTHETIDTQQGSQAEGLMRSRQLKVLAGDYYSSIFYQLLSDRGQIEVITLLSRAICDLNMMKMNLYGSMKSLQLSAEQYLVQKVQLNMQLFISFTPMLEEPLRDLWKSLLHEISLCEIVMQELNLTQEGQPLKYGYIYWEMMELASVEDKLTLNEIEIDPIEWKKMIHQYKPMEHMTNRLRESVDRIQHLLKSLKGDVRFLGIGQVVEPFQLFVNSFGTVLREG
ncbi:heptaprenyl diphosphate synthase component 1 [Paenibacillus antarcticus]|uniref:Heptaprenyl diphosphate synthase n=1 Tax=Paenibacillus antarcticus TaxID=253703 RepID=A0A168PMV1_9BACL|nr:heptaprenyl diphosphate synthase component 1 [Paenibacillus antarcticus]OAB46921.1 heptaprenyl diphosphate synthase [Paenibacillus antarcticus]